MDELIRSKIHDALDVEQPDGALRSRILASLPVEQRPERRLQARSFQLAGGLVAGFLALALVAALLYSRGFISPHPAQGGQCAHLYSPGVSMRVIEHQEQIMLINESTSTCTLKAPAVSFLDSSGNTLDVPQDWAPGATEGVVTLGARGAAVVPFSIESGPCSTPPLKFAFVRASFGVGAEVQIAVVGGLCQGSRILVSAPIPAVICADGSVVAGSPNISARKPTC